MHTKELLKIWAEKFLNSRTEAMSDDLSRIFMACFINESDPNFPPEEFKDSFTFKVVEKRAKLLGLNMTPAVATIICMLAGGAVGTAIMYIYALRYAQLRDNKISITLSELTNYFPMGFVQKDAISELWVAQKGYTLQQPFDNLLDTNPTLD